MYVHNNKIGLSMDRCMQLMLHEGGCGFMQAIGPVHVLCTLTYCKGSTPGVLQKQLINSVALCKHVNEVFSILYMHIEIMDVALHAFAAYKMWAWFLKDVLCSGLHYRASISYVGKFCIKCNSILG